MTLFDVNIRDSDVPLWALAASAVALLAALGSQYLGGLAPCELCLWQRVPYGAAIVIGIGAALWFRGARERTWLTWMCALVFATGAAIALYHVGVEQKWIAGPTACSGPADLNAAKTIDELRRQLLAAPVVRCDEVPWELGGISIAGFNAIASLVLAAYCALAGIRLVRDKPA